MSKNLNPADRPFDWPRFCNRLHGDASLLERLVSKNRDGIEAFATRLMRLGQDLADDFGAAPTRGHIQDLVYASRRAWLQRSSLNAEPEATILVSEQVPSANWLPINLHASAPPGFIDWACFGEMRLTEPFFEQSVGQALREPARLLFRQRTPVRVLDTSASEKPDLKPCGFVFHLSRCGSTLLAQMLASSPRHRVLSEMPAIDHLLAHDAAAGLPHARRVQRLRALIGLCARRRFPEEERLFIKWDAWHTIHLPVIREAFPDVPWVYLHREPVEVLVSQRRQRGLQLIPGEMAPEPFGISRAEIAAGIPFDEYSARVLGVSASAAVEALRGPGSPGKALDHRSLRTAWPGLLREHFGIELTEEDWSRMQAAAHRNAKNPALTFVDDRESKHREADEALRGLAKRWLDDSRKTLESFSDRPHACAPTS